MGLSWSSARARLALLIVAGCGVGACQRAAPPPRTTAVGTQTAAFLGAGDVPLVAEIWYPAMDTAREAPLAYGGRFRGRAARDAPPRLGRRRPLLLLSHDVGQDPFGLAWLGEALAAEGLVVVAPAHPEDGLAGSAQQLWRRAADLRAVRAAVMAGTELAAAIDPGRVALGGFGLGVHSALLAAGADLDPAAFVARFPDAGLPPDALAGGPPLAAILGLAPAAATLLDAASLRHVAPPVLLISPGAGPSGAHAAALARALPHAAAYTLAEADPSSLAPACTLRARWRTQAACHDGGQRPRAVVQAQVVDWARAYLRSGLGPTLGR